MKQEVVCFGEILWDMLPAGRQAGGAPFNVAVHLQQLGVPARLISSIGPDDLGQELLAVVAGKGLSTDCVQRSHLPTGVVHANVTDAQNVRYTIAEPAAWDAIGPDPAADALVAQAAVLVFGSLAARHATTRATLYGLLGHARLRVFDANLRPPHYSPEVVLHLLARTDLLKLNHHELAELMHWLGQAAEPATALPWLAERYHLQAVCVTLGAAGAVLWANGKLYQAAGVPVPVHDTIGSGDAFLAALLRGWLAGQAPDELLRFACAAGALVATQPGATPVISAVAVQAMPGT
ncbi:carbohydrate kinase family protein [Hymenobacter latericus]|uniref:carbohydrate kinase family protein n=1 Tax=Hymenobacter sp. YIM 151858-1 TaxID=2987688 RepID=UPI002225CC01|nr:carbohydrate kinase [Hymenobacter sp. YIM 151858-1]UYZ57940.1 carbohydrate kinase [Hymenobacter sp. YIM 151858-1]